jgi:hypothetical protein
LLQSFSWELELGQEKQRATWQGIPERHDAARPADRRQQSHHSHTDHPGERPSASFASPFPPQPRTSRIRGLPVLSVAIFGFMYPLQSTFVEGRVVMASENSFLASVRDLKFSRRWRCRLWFFRLWRPVGGYQRLRGTCRLHFRVEVLQELNAESEPRGQGISIF